MDKPVNAISVRVHPSNPRSKDYPDVGWITAEDWAYRAAGRYFVEVPVHFPAGIVNLHVIILGRVE